ncbi:YdcF family protein [Konateibacter massiliensis]|uniref:ElyC/SanA/YdcF family protein n=1 Tax=Konateibacter massiliensis TaxID=2002841 RepID=UPI000C14C784|nr:ElyC/SanA/YdcF family protein [Konateibacter massiliensis]
MKEKIAENINILGEFCGKRDVATLSKEELQKRYKFEKADVMVLFGGSILAGGDVLADAMKHDVADKYIIVGGAGHTTETLRVRMQEEYPDIQTKGLPEAEIFAAYLKARYDLEPDFLECESTNCGNNITYLLELMKEKNIAYKSIILAQDATMQHRMEATLRKYVSNDVVIINYAVYAANVTVKNEELEFEEKAWGMWEMERYIMLLMGEIPRLSDDEGGYGPKGKNYIAHVEIPDDVKKAFLELKQEYGGLVREANPLYASKNK